MNYRISCLLSRIVFLVVPGCLLPCTQVVADSSSPLTLIYSGQERGLIRLHGCRTEQVGGLARRHTVIRLLREEHPHALNLHTGNILDSANPNNELIYQIALEALSGKHSDKISRQPDYEVVYIRESQIGRVSQNGMLNGNLEHVIRLNGIDHVWIYRIKGEDDYPQSG